MIVLKVKVGDEVRIGDAIAVRVCRSRRRDVQLAITAPREVRVDRAEIAERRDADRRAGVMKQREIFR